MAPTLSGLPTMAAQSTPKTMSSRLMTMKFMQRGAASESNSPTTPRSDNEGSAKRRKVSHVSAKSSPSTPIYDQKAVQAALEEEERKRQAAIEKRALELGDSRWVLDASLPTTGASSHSLLNIVQVGFAQIDSTVAPGDRADNTEEAEPTPPSNLRRYNMHKSKDRDSSSSESDSSDSGSDSEEDADASSSPASQRPRGRSEHKARVTGAEKRRRSGSGLSKRREEERTKAQQLAEKRRKKEVKLNKLTSISSSGSSLLQAMGSSRGQAMKCYGCGQPGHRAADCPRKASR